MILCLNPGLKDVSEAIVNSNAPSGVPADQRLVGTDAHHKYVEKLVPGSEWGKQFINKYEKVRIIGLPMGKHIFEEGPRKGHAAGDTSIEQQASQLASDIKYKARQKMKGSWDLI